MANIKISELPVTTVLDPAATLLVKNITGGIETTEQMAVGLLVKGTSFLYTETPSGDVNGVNVDFDIVEIPAENGLSVYRNGVLQNEGASNDYTYTYPTITFNTAPLTGDILIAKIIVGVAADTPSEGTGTVTSMSVATANGFAGTVTSPTTTPVVTLKTGVTGLLLGNGTGVSAAVNTDLPTMTATASGAVPTPPNNTTTFLRGDGTFAIPAVGGDVSGPATNTASYIPQWDGANSKLLKDGLGLDTDISTVSASDDTIPSAKAVKTYADGLVAGLLDYRGAYDASVNTFPAAGGSGTAGAVLKGDMWILSAAGTLGGVAVQVGDSVIANTDTPGQTAGNWNILNANVSYVPEDQANKEDSTIDTSTTKYPTVNLLKTGLDAKASLTGTETLTNKRITPRVGTTASSGTPTINTDNYDAYSITALSEAITSMTTNLSGTPTNFQKLIIRILDDGTDRAITWGASFAAKGVALPTTTTASKLLTVGFIYDTVAATRGCVASVEEA